MASAATPEERRRRQPPGSMRECRDRAPDRPPDGATPARRRGPREPSSPGSIVVAGFGAQRGRRRLDVAAFGQNFYAPLRLFEPRMAEAGELDAALEQLERLFQRQVPILEP